MAISPGTIIEGSVYQRKTTKRKVLKIEHEILASGFTVHYAVLSEQGTAGEVKSCWSSTFALWADCMVAESHA